jgi:hypothetical protein
MNHRHHILPIRLGGTDEEDNLTPPISYALHAAFHKDLYEYYGHQEDYIAWKALSGRITGEEARLAAAKVGQDKSTVYKKSRKKCGELLLGKLDKEACSRGGKSASKKLVAWQKANREKFIENCRRIGKAGTERKKIPHEYLGVKYNSKRDLQNAYSMSNHKFYRLLSTGEIRRLERG